MFLPRESLLLERARPSVTRKPKARTRRISSRRQLGGTRRDLFSRLERRARDRVTPQCREVLRSLARIRYVRRRPEHPLISGHVAPRTLLMKGHRL